MSFLSRAEIGPAIRMEPKEAAKARRMLKRMGEVVHSVTDHCTGIDGNPVFECRMGFHVFLEEDDESGLSIHVLDQTRTSRRMGLHLHGRPAHIRMDEDPVSKMILAIGLAGQCVSVASSVRAMRPDDPRTSHSEDLRRHARRLCAEALADGFVLTGSISEEAVVRHPWADATGTQRCRYLIGGEVRGSIRPLEVEAERLLGLMLISDDSDTNLHIGGCIRSSSIAAVAKDPMETMRLVSELQTIRGNQAA